MDEPVRMDDLVSQVTAVHPDGDALVHLRDAALMADRLGELADQLVGHFVDEARRAGVTWAEIGRSMGVTRQAAQKRFVPRTVDLGVLDPAIYDRFTPRARAVIAASQDEARAAGHDYVGTEHLVLALLSQPAGLAAKALAQKTTPQQLRAAVSEVLGPPSDSVPDQIPYTPRATRAIQLTVQQAQRLGHDYVGTEHILLGILSEKHGVGATIIHQLGLDQNTIEQWLATQ